MELKLITEETESNNSKINNEKCLIIFDFDNTIIDGDTYETLINLLNKEEFEKTISNSNVTWSEYLKLLFNKLKENGMNTEAIKKHVLSLEFIKNIKDVFEFIKENRERYTSIIISGSIKTLIHHIMEHNGYIDVIDAIFSNESSIDDDNYYYYVQVDHKKCEECNFSICKSVILSNYLKREKKFGKLIYVGDGIIDKCPTKILTESDTLFPRKDFPLYREIYEEGYIKHLKCKVFPWVDGKHILEQL
jgi:pyridoxal phosphate phosphatase PHOSPHO2